MTLFQNMRKGLLPARLTVAEIYDLTAAGVLAENEPIELIEGEVIPMAAAKVDWHSIMVSRLMHGIIPRLSGDPRLYAEASVTLSLDTLVEPDLAIWSRRILPRQVRGPDLLLLIEVSDSSIAYDLHVKAPLYAAHGVREYWVVDAVRQTIRVHRAPQGGVYSDVEEYEAHDSVTALLLPEVCVRLDTLD
ncbi:Uma2 family endonuclease [Sphingomonas sp. S2-65]|uniref:Uma2 family endonuclease n=1 Tax=Sphingomonas sp. S2-65 TaxID=2903960 RepID=UPI001F189552|nr:Uma2 family endonuclease [Sphingomonas sp. S2-65]UYY58243.1 Uma2 family endonuclease [Sphingomonas sp. S2-65]